jgi:hypothetical protein
MFIYHRVSEARPPWDSYHKPKAKKTQCCEVVVIRPDLSYENPTKKAHVWWSNQHF